VAVAACWTVPRSWTVLSLLRWRRSRAICSNP